MTIERALRAMAGFFVMLSVALGYWVHPGFFLFTAFVGLNLFQSAFTNACPAMAIFRKLGLRPAYRQTPRRSAREGEIAGPAFSRVYGISIVPQRVPFGATGQSSAAQASNVPFTFATAMNCSVGWLAQLSGK